MNTDIIPYFPSGLLWRQYMATVLTGGDYIEGYPFIHPDITVKPREIARTLVAGAGDQPPVRLSVAIEGGSSVVKRGHSERWLLSDHGRWRRMHLGAIDAAYGSTPYFRHLYPMIEEALMSAEAGTPFSSLTERLHRICLEFMEFEDTIRELRDLRAADFDKFCKIVREFSCNEDTNLAFIDVMFRKGRDSVFTLLSPV